MILGAAKAEATVKPPKPETPASQPTNIAVGAAAGSVSNADARAVSGSQSAAVAGGGNAVAAGGEGGEASSDANSNSGGNSLAVTTVNPRQAPSVGQGSLYIPSCGVAGNAGGSRDSGSAFLGFAFTPKDCKLLLVAAAYQALGMVDSSCLLLNETSVAKKLWGNKPPPCVVKAEVDTSKFVTAEKHEKDLALLEGRTIERDKRQFERSTSK